MRRKDRKIKNLPLKAAKLQKQIVVIALPLLSEGEMTLIQGVREGFAHRDNLEVVVLSGGFEATLRKIAESGQLAGAIGEFMSDLWLKSLLERDIKIVRIGEGIKKTSPSATKGMMSISSDFPDMGLEAARSLLDGGVQGFGYLGPVGAPGSVRLGEAFGSACSANGHAVARCQEFSNILIRDFLRSLPRPSGLLCSSDHLARLAIVAAGEEGIRVPADLAVMGVGNMRLESLHAGLAISSFDLQLQEIGRLAGTAMSGLLEGKSSLGDGDLKVRALLHERESSLRSGQGVSRAMAWLKSHPGDPINAGELARIAGMSRRSFEMALRVDLGCSPGELLREVRRARAERLLMESPLGVGAVGLECGYPDAAVFSAAFKRWTGKSPREFQRNGQKKPVAQSLRMQEPHSS